MKEHYLSSTSISDITNEMVAELTSHHYRPKPWNLDPEKAALLVLDMQNYFLDPSSHAFTPSAPAIVPNINKLFSLAEKFKMEIVFTRHVNNNKNAGMMGSWWKDLIAEGSWESAISKTVGRYDGNSESPVRNVIMVDGKTESPVRDVIMVEIENSITITKNQYDAFYNTDLEEYLRSKKVEQVIITGVLTNLCCESTARSAFVRGFEVFFPMDATAAYNREFHLSTFRNLCFGFCPVLTTPELINSLNESE